MHSRCCWPPESPAPGSSRRSATSSHRPAPRSAASTSARRSPRPRRAEAQAGGDVVEDRHRRERVRLLEDHADRRGAPRRRRPTGSYTSRSSSSTRPSRARSGDLLVHAVDAADHRRLAAPRRPDDRGHLVGAELEVDALDLLGVAVERAQLLEPDAQPGLAATSASLRAAPVTAVAEPVIRREPVSGSAAVEPCCCRLELRALSGSTSVASEVDPSDVMQGDSFARSGGRCRLSSRIIATSVSAAPHARLYHGRASAR